MEVLIGWSLTVSKGLCVRVSILNLMELGARLIETIKVNPGEKSSGY